MAAFLVAFLLGVVVGSFLNLCIRRLPACEPLAGRPSCCLTGGSPFTARNVFVALATGVLFVWCLAVFGPGAVLAKALILTSFLVVIAVIDYDHRLILDKVVAVFAATGVVVNLALYLAGGLWSLAANYASPLGMLLGGLLGGGLMLLVAIVPGSGMGGGDIKFAAALGLWFGWQLILPTLLLTFVFGGVGATALLLLRRKGRKDYMPYGPFIAAGAFVILLYGPAIVAWYARHWTGR